jgi:nucleoside-diphosphate-sugar epimerase
MHNHFTVLGASGYVGESVVKYLKDKDYEVNTPARNDCLFAGKEMGHVLYCIGLTSDYATRPFDTVTAHIEVLNKVLQFGKFSSFVYLSSTRLYDGSDSTQEGTSLLLNPANPRHLYDFSKGAGEALCHQSERDNVRIARLSNVYGGSCRGDNLIHTLLSKMKLSQNIRLANNPLLERDYVHIDDVCEALISIALFGRHSIYNVASGRNQSNISLAKIIQQSDKARIYFDYKETDQTVPELQKTICTLRLKELGISPRDMKRGINQTLENF